jgi:type 1 glutamine amidotransferase
MRLLAILFWATLDLSFTAVHAAAQPIPDCPLRDARFSIDMPVMDIMASKEAVALVTARAPQLLTMLPAGLMRPTAPNFSAVIALRSIAHMTKLDANTLADLDRALRRLPVRTADRAHRCARYDATPQSVAVTGSAPALLIFERMTGFRDGPAVEAARAAITAMARARGWQVIVTDKAGAISPANLALFSTLIWNNISGDVLTLGQRRALRSYIERGGGFLATHGSAGDIDYFWPWYQDVLIGARFIGHPLNPQFQTARLVRDPAGGALGAGLPPEWTMHDEWYSFAPGPRLPDTHVVARLDESSYTPVGIAGDIRMGADHPIAWARCVGKGRAFYTAIGHRPENYDEPHHTRIIAQALDWTMIKGSGPCVAKRQ